MCFRSVCVLAIALCALTVPRPAQAFPPDKLSDAAKRSVPYQSRVPLLLIAPETTEIGWENSAGREKLRELFREESAMPPLADTLAAYNRQVMSCGSVKVVAPVTRVRLNPFPGDVSEWARIGRERAARLLLGSLTKAQWNMASGASGLGLGDLSTDEQRAWFRSLIPDPFVLQQVHAGDSPGSTTYSGDDATATVDAAQVRVRVVRTLSWNYAEKGKEKNGGRYGYGGGSSSFHRAGEAFWITDTGRSPMLPSSYTDKLADAVRLVEPNRVEKSDLSFAAAPLAGATISLKDAKTVGDLIVRIAEATGVEVYADRRVAGLAMQVMGTGSVADAGDLLKALCYAVGGTVRRVTDPESKQSVFILTHDKAGLLTVRAKLAEWASDVEALTNAEQTAFQSTVQSAGIVGAVGFAEDGSPSLDADTMQKAEAQLTDPLRYQKSSFGDVRVPVTALPASTQEQVRRDVAHHRENYNGAELDDKTVYASFGVEMKLVAPGYGTFSGAWLGSLESFLPPVPPARVPPPPLPPGTITLPPVLRGFAALKIAPKDDAEMERAAKWATDHKFALFVRVADPKTLARYAAIGKARGVPVYACVSLLRIDAELNRQDADNEKSSSLPSAPLALAAPQFNSPARNIWGETLREYAKRRERAPALTNNPYLAPQLADLQTGDWLDSTDAKTREAVAARLRETLGISEDSSGTKEPIAGVLLERLAAPGMNESQSDYYDQQLFGRLAGYTDPLRVAFIRQENIDPLDLPPGEYGMSPYIRAPQEGLVPYFSMDYQMREQIKQSPARRKNRETGAWETVSTGAGGETGKAWLSLCAERNRDAVGQIRQAAHLPPTLSVWYENPSDSSSGLSQYTAPWAPTDALYPAKRGKDALLPLTLRAASTPDSVRRGLTTSLAQRLKYAGTVPYAGIVIDATAKPVGEALTLLAPLDGQ